MKKLACVILIFVLCVSLCACKQDVAEDKEKGTFSIFGPTLEITPTSKAEETAKPTEAEPTDEATKEATEETGGDTTLVYDDFTISFPGDWRYETGEIVENEPLFVIYSPFGASSINMIWDSDTSFSLEDFDEEFAQRVVDIINAGLDLDFTLTMEWYEIIRFGNKESAVVYCSFVNDDWEVAVLELITPTENGTYFLTCSLINEGDAAPMINVVKNLAFN